MVNATTLSQLLTWAYTQTKIYRQKLSTRYQRQTKQNENPTPFGLITIYEIARLICHFLCGSSIYCCWYCYYYFFQKNWYVSLCVSVCGATSQELFAVTIFFGLVFLKRISVALFERLCVRSFACSSTCVHCTIEHTSVRTLCSMWLELLLLVFLLYDWILSHSTLTKCANTLIFASSFLLHISTVPFDLIFLSFNFQFVKDLVALKLVESFLNFFHCVCSALFSSTKTQFFNALSMLAYTCVSFSLRKLTYLRWAHHTHTHALIHLFTTSHLKRVPTDRNLLW